MAPRSPIVPIDPEPFIGVAEAEARRRRETLEAAVWGGKIFRPAGVAGKGSHRRGPETSARRQPPAPKFQEFHLRTEVRDTEKTVVLHALLKRLFDKLERVFAIQTRNKDKSVDLECKQGQSCMKSPKTFRLCLK